jgi:hypothetical protein
MAVVSVLTMAVLAVVAVQAVELAQIHQVHLMLTLEQAHFHKATMAALVVIQQIKVQVAAAALVALEQLLQTIMEQAVVLV